MLLGHEGMSLWEGNGSRRAVFELCATGFASVYFNPRPLGEKVASSPGEGSNRTRHSSVCFTKYGSLCLPEVPQITLQSSHPEQGHWPGPLLGKQAALTQFLNVSRCTLQDTVGRVLEDRQATEADRSCQNRNAVFVFVIELPL